MTFTGKKPWLLAFAFVSALGLSEANYWEDLKTRNGTTFVGWEYSTAICETRNNFDLARAGGNGWYWVPISIPEFCRLAHQHRSNGCDYKKVRSLSGFYETTTNCYERDRMVTWCQAHRNLHDKHFRCRNLNAERDAQRDRVNAERKRAYEVWKEQVKEKKRILLVENEPVRKNLERDLSHQQWKLAEAKKETVMAEERAKATKVVVDQFLGFQDRFVQELESNYQQFDQLVGDLEIAMEEDGQKIKDAVEVLKAVIDGSVSSAVTKETLVLLKERLKGVEQSNGVCQKTKSSRKLSELRALTAKLNGMISAYETKVTSLNLAAEYGELRGTFAANLSTIANQVSLRRDFFGKDAGELEKPPQFCQMITQVSSLIEVRALQATTGGAGAALGQVANDFAQQVKKAHAQLIAGQQQSEASRFILGIEASFSSNLNQGRVAEALADLERLKSGSSLMLANLTEMGTAEAVVSSLASEAGQAKERMLKKKVQFLDLAGMRARSTTRLKQIKLVMKKVGSDASNSESTQLEWTSSVVPRIVAAFGPAYDSGMAPSFVDENESLAFDGQLAKAEIEIETFVGAKQAAGGTP